MTARDAILQAIHRMDREEFTIMDVLRELDGSGYSEGTIRTHIASRMCAEAPDHHATTFSDLRRVGRGRYRLA